MSDEQTTLERGEPGSKLAESVTLTATVLTGVARGARRLIGKRTTIGKASDNHLVLPDRTVSRRHCELVRTNEGVLVRDLGSTNGTRVNGIQISEAIARPGATLRVGGVEIAIRPSAQPVTVLPSERDRFGGVVGKSVAMRSIFGVLEYLAPSDASILLEGETGTGKETLARAIVLASRRKKAPFEIFDCNVASHALLESELFGHEKGAFTGAETARRGLFETADRGTVFLDGIDELPLELQPKLLRVLEAGEIKRLGGRRPSKVDVRIIAATKRDLMDLVAAGTFREDLYFRLAVVPVKVPPLDARREDIPLLVTTLLGALGAKDVTVTDEVMSELLVREYRGNVRELRNLLERAMGLARAGGASELDVSHLATARAAASTFRFDGSQSLDETLARCARAYARWLVTTHGSEEAAAAAAGISVARLVDLVEQA